MKRALVLAAVGLGIGLGAQAHAAVAVQAQGGVESYSGDLNNALRAGPAWGVTADIQPKAPIGLELGYLGASNQLYGSGSIFNGPREARVLQNGAEALAHISLAHSNNAVVEPFVAGGIGATRYELSNPVAGFQNDTVGMVPVGLGVNFHPRLGHRYFGGGDSVYASDSQPAHARPERSSLEIGIRGDYDFLFSDQFEMNQATSHYGLFTKQGGDSYRGLITLGGNW